MRLFVSQRRAIRRPRVIGEQGKLLLKDLAATVVLIVFMVFCFVGLPKLLSDGPDGVRICFIHHCPTVAQESR